MAKKMKHHQNSNKANAQKGGAHPPSRQNSKQLSHRASSKETTDANAIKYTEKPIAVPAALFEDCPENPSQAHITSINVCFIMNDVRVAVECKAEEYMQDKKIGRQAHRMSQAFKKFACLHMPNHLSDKIITRTAEFRKVWLDPELQKRSASVHDLLLEIFKQVPVTCCTILWTELDIRGTSTTFRLEPSLSCWHVVSSPFKQLFSHVTATQDFLDHGAPRAKMNPDGTTTVQIAPENPPALLWVTLQCKDESGNWLEGRRLHSFKDGGEQSLCFARYNYVPLVVVYGTAHAEYANIDHYYLAFHDRTGDKDGRWIVIDGNRTAIVTKMPENNIVEIFLEKKDKRDPSSSSTARFDDDDSLHLSDTSEKDADEEKPLFSDAEDDGETLLPPVQDTAPPLSQNGDTGIKETKNRCRLCVNAGFTGPAIYHHYRDCLIYAEQNLERIKNLKATAQASAVPPSQSTLLRQNANVSTPPPIPVGSTSSGSGSNNLSNVGSSSSGSGTSIPDPNAPKRNDPMFAGLDAGNVAGYFVDSVSKAREAIKETGAKTGFPPATIRTFAFLKLGFDLLIDEPEMIAMKDADFEALSVNQHFYNYPWQQVQDTINRSNPWHTNLGFKDGKLSGEACKYDSYANVMLKDKAAGAGTPRKRRREDDDLDG